MGTRAHAGGQPFGTGAVAAQREQQLVAVGQRDRPVRVPQAQVLVEIDQPALLVEGAQRLLTRAEVLGDQDAGGAAVALARERGIPHEAAVVFRRAALSCVDTAALLAESYELYGELDALLWRARLRVMVREHDVTVPGRRTSTRENERLLAVLVAEGLANRQLAQVLATSEKSV